MREYGRATPFSFLRHVICDVSTHDDIRTMLERGDAEKLLSDGKRLQSKPRCEVARIDHVAGPMLLKRHTWGGVGRTLRMALRAPVARKCFQHAQWLHDRRVPTPRPLALVEDRVGPVGIRSYLLTEFIEGESLFDVVRWGELPPERCDRLAKQVATVWQQLIDLNVAHGDMKPENFIVDRDDRVWLIDLEKLRRSPPQSRFLRQHLVDAESFLHVRTWRHALEAAEIFRAALADTSLGDWARQQGSASRPALAPGYSAEELALRVRVVILTDPNTRADQIEATRKSVRVLTNDVVVTDKLPAPPPTESTFWFLLRPGERISADLARHLVETLLHHPQVAAVRVPLNTCDSAGRRRSVPDPVVARGWRVFHAARTTLPPPSVGIGLSHPICLGRPIGPVPELQDAIEVDAIVGQPLPTAA